MPIGTDLVMHEESEPEKVRNDGAALGLVIERAARHWGTPLAVPLMDLRLEKIDGSECNVLFVPEARETIGKKVEAMMTVRSAG